jgi:hypothetical protein
VYFVLFEVVIASVIISSSLHARNSFFMNEEQSNEMTAFVKGDHRNGSKTHKEEGEHDPEALKISGIFYIDGDTWTVWINEAAYSTIGQHKDFSIDSVGEDYITLTLNDGRTITMPVTIQVTRPDIDNRDNGTGKRS